MPNIRRSSLGRRSHRAIISQIVNVDLNRAAFECDSAIAYKDLCIVDTGSLSVACLHCNALKFQSETPDICSGGGKMKLPTLSHPPEPLYSFLNGNTIQSKRFLANTQKYNGRFQMTSFGGEVVDQPGFNPSYKIQGQIHHRAGALLPPPSEDYQFLQIYFVGDSAMDQRYAICKIFCVILSLWSLPEGVKLVRDGVRWVR